MVLDVQNIRQKIHQLQEELNWERQNCESLQGETHPRLETQHYRKGFNLRLLYILFIKDGLIFIHGPRKAAICSPMFVCLCRESKCNWCKNSMMVFAPIVFFVTWCRMVLMFSVMCCLRRNDATERTGSRNYRNPESPERHSAAGVQSERHGHGEQAHTNSTSITGSEKMIFKCVYFRLEYFIVKLITISNLCSQVGPYILKFMFIMYHLA